MYRTVTMYNNKHYNDFFPSFWEKLNWSKRVEEIFSDGTFLDNLFKRIPSLEIFLIFLKILPSISLFVNIKFRIPLLLPPPPPLGKSIRKKGESLLTKRRMNLTWIQNKDIYLILLWLVTVLQFLINRGITHYTYTY